MKQDVDGAEVRTTHTYESLMESPSKTMIEYFRRKVADALYVKAVRASGISQSTITTGREGYAVYSVLDAILRWLDSWTQELTLDELISILGKTEAELQTYLEERS